MLQSLTPLQVPRPQLRPAIALNSMGINVARAIGPALGGLIIATASIALVFFIDALTYLAFSALWWWKGAAAPTFAGESPEAFGGAWSPGHASRCMNPNCSARCCARPSR